MAKQRFRLQYKFWLDANKPDEYKLAEQIDQLKQGRAFSQVVRDGIALIIDLWNGNLDVLLALFPWVEEAFFSRFNEQQPLTERTLQEQLFRLEQLLMEQGNMPVSTISSGPKSLTTLAPSKPVEDDDDVMLSIKKAKSNGDSAKNFLDSAFAIAGLQ